MTARCTLILALGAVLCACWPFGGGGRSKLEGRYSVEHPGRPWAAVDPGGADRAWWHTENGTTLYTDSNCEQAYVDNSLERLAQAQAAAIDDATLRESTQHRLAGRAALTATFDGQVDGVPVVVTTTVLKKDQCIYDFVMVAPVNGATGVLADYESVVASFQIIR